MSMRGIVRFSLLTLWFVVMVGAWETGFAADKSPPGLICRSEVESLEGKQIEIIVLKKRDDGQFDLIYTEPYFEGKEKPSTTYVANALKMVNTVENNPKLIELHSSTHGQPGAYFFTIKTSILTETVLAASGSSLTHTILAFRYSKALQDLDLNHMMIDKGIYEMPLDTCQVQ